MDLDDVETSLERIERKVDLILARLGMAGVSSPNLVDRVADLMARGQKIEAIKVWRTETDCGLKEAKDAVERIALERGLD